MKISVIAIFYNSTPWMRLCIDSILSQQGDFDLELIAVDDCSTDHTLEILHCYAEADRRVNVIHHDVNQGISATRNTGLEHVNGDCFFFIDGDASLPEGALARLTAEFSDEVDWVHGGYSLRNEQGVEIGKMNKPTAICHNHQEISKKFPKLEFSQVHNRLINARLKDVRFPVGEVHEDVAWNMAAYPRLNKIINIKDTTYNYLYRESSVCHRGRNPRLFIENMLKRIQQMNEHPDAIWHREALLWAATHIDSIFYMPDNSFTPEYRRQLWMDYLRICPLKGPLSTLPLNQRLLHRLIEADAPMCVIRMCRLLIRISRTFKKLIGMRKSS